MALQAVSLPSAQVVGNAFVEQYYHILHNSPELVYRFYQDTSVLSRPDSNGVMTSVTTMEGINKTILSLDFKNFKAEIETADAQNSHKEGVTVLVTGCLTGKDNLRRKFAQSFFLAPQDIGYFVLNDVFRYVEDDKASDKHPVNIAVDNQIAPFFSEKEAACVPDQVTSHVGEDEIVPEEVQEPLNLEGPFSDEEEVVLVPQSHTFDDEASAMVESTTSSAQEDAPKKSYASIVKVAKSNAGHKLYVPTNAAKSTHKKTENQSLPVAKPASHSEISGPVSTETEKSNNAHNEAENCSIYVRNLPFNITATELEGEFKKFGEIKRGGVQVRHNKDFCFGFVEFQSTGSVDYAIQAAPVKIGGQEVIVEKKKSTGGRPSFDRGRFRSDNFRRRGGYGGGGRAYVRNDYGNWGDFTSPGRGSPRPNWGDFTSPGRGSTGRGDSYQRGRGRARGGNAGGQNQKAVISA